MSGYLDDMLSHLEQLEERRERMSNARQSLSDIDSTIRGVERQAFPLLVAAYRERGKRLSAVAALDICDCWDRPGAPETHEPACAHQLMSEALNDRLARP